jgi:regulator of cell morphogenesis and NO signaling
MILEKYDQSLLGEIVADDFRTAEVFKKAGIDFCCGGKKSLEQACNEKNIDKISLINELKELALLPIGQSLNFNHWNLDFLCDYIMNTHHKYVIKTLSELIFYLQKITSVHGHNHPELIEITDIFSNINIELLQHLKQEEEVLFPAIKEILTIGGNNVAETIVSEITRMNDEHESAGGAMDRIHEMTNDYQVPEDACNTYKVAFQLLRQFEDDLHIHVHLENNILYPKAMKLAEGSLAV